MATTTQADIDETERQHLEEWSKDTDSEDYTDGSAELVRQGKIEAEREYEQAWAEEPTQAEAAPVTVPSTIEAKDVQPAPPEPTVKHAKFGDAFKAARAAHLNDGGPAVFDWNGKSYTTRLKGEAPLTPSKPTASTTAKAPPASTAKEPSTTTPDTPTQSVAPIAATRPSELATPTEATPPPVSKHSQIHVPGPSGGELKLHRIKLQKAYDDWQSAKSENTTWYGGRAVMRPGMAERQAEAEQRYLRLLKNPV
jgi:hypothetical protein